MGGQSAERIRCAKSGSDILEVQAELDKTERNIPHSAKDLFSRPPIPKNRCGSIPGGLATCGVEDNLLFHNFETSKGTPVVSKGNI